MEVNWGLRISKAFIHFRSASLRKAFKESLENPAKAQQDVLKTILKLSSANSLPKKPTSFQDYPRDQSWTSEPVRFFETTSGSSGMKKNIPYTKSILKSFENMFLLWCDDVLKNHNLESGRLFISFSPQLKSMGLDSDLEYLSPFLQRLLKNYFSVQPELFRADDGQTFLRNVTHELVRDPKLEVISIWSPSYFISLLETIESLDLSDTPELQRSVQDKNWQAIWPNLKLISCWADGSSQAQYQNLKRLFPYVAFQPKGLLATEAPLTIPWHQSGDGGVPLWNEVYLEYIDASGVIRNLYDMKPGDEGEILVSTKGGLLRYRLGDVVQCCGYYKRTPQVRFLKRAGEVSDLVGEKLDSAILSSLFSGQEWGYWTVVPHGNRYVFLSDREISSATVDEKLKNAHHYGLARELQQLKSVEVFFVSKLKDKYFQFCEMRGMKKGDIKDRLLWADSKFLEFLKS